MAFGFLLLTALSAWGYAGPLPTGAFSGASSAISTEIATSIVVVEAGLPRADWQCVRARDNLEERDEMKRSNADRIQTDPDRVRRDARDAAPRTRIATALPALAIIGAAPMVVAVVVAGLWLGLPPRVGQLGAQASASRVEPSAVEPLASPITRSPLEPSVSSIDRWGPLAVIPPQGGADTGRAEGKLRITDSCVLLESPGEVMLLFWPADRTTWSAESRAISFKNFDGSVFTVSDGDHVVLGGGGDSEAESGISGAEWVRRTKWVAPPASSCPLDPRWGVGGVGDGPPRDGASGSGPSTPG